MKKNKLVNGFIIGTKVGLYLIVSVISTIHVINFFGLSNPDWLAISLAVAFEIGAAASLASIIVLEKTNRTMVWFLFLLLTAMQMMGNTYFAYVNLHDFQGWSELFGLAEEELIFQKRILSLISGAILPIIALGFIKSLVDYIKPAKTKEESINIPDNIHEVIKDGTPDISNDSFGKIALDDVMQEEEFDNPETEEENSKKKVESVAEELKTLPFEGKVERIIEEEKKLEEVEEEKEEIKHEKKIIQEVKEEKSLSFFSKKPIKITEKNSPSVVTDERKEKIRKQESGDSENKQ